MNLFREKKAQMNEQTFVLIMRSNMMFSGEIYTTGKNFTLPPAVTGVTNITSASNQPSDWDSQNQEPTVAAVKCGNWISTDKKRNSHCDHKSLTMNHGK